MLDQCRRQHDMHGRLPLRPRGLVWFRTELAVTVGRGDCIHVWWATEASHFDTEKIPARQVA